MDTVIDGTLTHFSVINPKAKKDCLILHGWGQNSTLWQPLARQLSNKYRYFLLDLPGFGNSSHLTGSPNVPQYTQFIQNFIQSQKIKKPIIIGHSFGGQIAAFLALKHPQSISSLILISPSIIRHKTLKDKLKIFIYSRFSFLKKFISTSLIRLILSQISSSDYASVSPRHQAILKNIVNFHFHQQLSHINTPVTILWGDQDQEISYTGKYLAQSLPHARLFVLYGADHNPHINAPSQLATHINLSLL